MSAGCQITDRY